MRYTITTRGVEKSETGEFATWAEVTAAWNARTVVGKPLTAEDKYLAIHRVPINPANATRRQAEYDRNNIADDDETGQYIK